MKKLKNIKSPKKRFEYFTEKMPILASAMPLVPFLMLYVIANESWAKGQNGVVLTDDDLQYKVNNVPPEIVEIWNKANGE